MPFIGKFIRIDPDATIVSLKTKVISSKIHENVSLSCLKTVKKSKEIEGEIYEFLDKEVCKEHEKYVDDRPIPEAIVKIEDIGYIRSEKRSEERRVGKEGRSRWSPYH